VTRSSRASDRLDLAARLERSRQNRDRSGVKGAVFGAGETPGRLVYAYQSAGRSTKARMLGVVCLSVMSRCSDSDLPQDKALGTFARNRHSCHRSTHVDRGWSMTLNFMPLVILFGLALLLVGRTNDQQTQQTAMNMSICVLAIRSGFSNRRSGLQTNQLCATGFRGSVTMR
jgi:hypothetical protein